MFGCIEFDMGTVPVLKPAADSDHSVFKRHQLYAAFLHIPGHAFINRDCKIGLPVFAEIQIGPAVSFGNICNPA